MPCFSWGLRTVMTDPHDYELTEEEHEALLLRSEHAIAPPLSPAARAVLDAATKAAWSSAFNSEGKGAAAALRAASSQLKSAKSIDTLQAIATELEELGDA